MNSVKNSRYNIVFGILFIVVTTVLGIILPRLFITSYGSEVNGLTSSISQVFSYLTLMEVGVGVAALNALYGPVGKAQHLQISRIMSATNIFYKRTAMYYLVGVIAFVVLYPMFVKSEIPSLTQRLIIILFGASGIVRYLFQAKYHILLQAEGKIYISTIITTIAHILINVSKILLISYGFNVVFLYVSTVILSLAESVFYFNYIKKHYSWLDLKVFPDKLSISQSNSVLIHQISGMVFNHTDVFLLTFIKQDLKLVSIYSIYNILVSLVSTLIGHIANGFWFKLGQYYNTSKDDFKRLFDTFETYYMVLSFSMYNVTLMFLKPFIVLYTSGITDANYVDELIPILFISYKLLVTARAACSNSISFAQLFKVTQSRAILEMCINLTVSIIAVYKYGIYGVLFGTIVALLYRANDIIIFANKWVLQRSSWMTYRKWIVNFLIFIVCYYLFRQLNLNLDSYGKIIFYAVVSFIINFSLYFFINSVLFKGDYLKLKNYIQVQLKTR